MYNALYSHCQEFSFFDSTLRMFLFHLLVRIFFWDATVCCHLNHFDWLSLFRLSIKICFTGFPPFIFSMIHLCSFVSYSTHNSNHQSYANKFTDWHFFLRKRKHFCTILKLKNNHKSIITKMMFKLLDRFFAFFILYRGNVIIRCCYLFYAFLYVLMSSQCFRIPLNGSIFSGFV